MLLKYKSFVSFFYLENLIFYIFIELQSFKNNKIFAKFSHVQNYVENVLKSQKFCTCFDIF